MVEPQLTKQVLYALAGALPEDDAFEVTGIDIRRGWGDIVNVTIYGTGPADPGPAARAVREAVQEALGAERHNVRIETRP